MKDLMKWADEEAKKQIEDRLKEKQNALRNGQKEEAVRQAALRKLQGDCSAINGWRIRVQHNNELKNEVVNYGSGVVKSCTKARLGRPRVFTVIFDEGGVGDEKKKKKDKKKKKEKEKEKKKGADGDRELEIVLDCDNPHAGQRYCRGGKWVFMKYPFELIGGAPERPEYISLGAAKEGKVANWSAGRLWAGIGMPPPTKVSLQGVFAKGHSTI